MCAFAAAAIGEAAALVAAEPPCIAIFDGRRSAPPAAIRVIDVARDSANYWRELRSIDAARRIVGATNWSDFLQIRGLLQERGFRLIAIRHRDGLEHWSMAPRAALRAEEFA